MTMEIVGNDAQFNGKVTLLKDLEIYGNIKNKTKDTSLDFSDNLSFKIQGNEKLRITSDDVTISAQNLNIESVSTFNDDVVFAGAVYNMKWDHSTNDLILFDNTRLEFGSNKDFEIWHGGSHTFLKNSGGDLRIRGDKILLKRADGTERYLEANVNSEVKLFFNGDEKFETTNTGVVVTGICTATSFSGSGANLTGIEAFVTGMIILWSGAADAIPSGFVLCNGSNGTPDLRGRFVVGYHDGNSDYDVNDTGGSESVTLTVNQLPAHTHTHTKATHPAGSGPEQNQSGGPEDRTNFGDTGTTSSTGGGQSHENRPPYYALCYIMKT